MLVRAGAQRFLGGCVFWVLGFQCGFDGFEVGEVFWGWGLFGVLDDAVLVDDEGGACGGVADVCEAWEEDVVGFGDFFVEVADEGDVDFFFLSPGFLSEGAVYADADDGGVEVGVGAEACGDFAEFIGADAGEGEWEE